LICGRERHLLPVRLYFPSHPTICSRAVSLSSAQVRHITCQRLRKIQSTNKDTVTLSHSRLHMPHGHLPSLSASLCRGRSSAFSFPLPTRKSRVDQRQPRSRSPSMTAHAVCCLPLTTVRSSEARHNTSTRRPSGERQKTLATNSALRLESGCLRVTALFRRLTSPATGSLDSHWLVRLADSAAIGPQERARHV
jgi:hypothetical protein